MASGDKSTLLEIPAAWISKGLDLDPSSFTQPSSKRAAYIKTLESPTPPCTSCDPPLPSSAAIVIYSTPLASYHALTLSRPEHRMNEATFAMHLSSTKAAGATPQNTPSPFGGTPNASSSVLPPSVDTSPPQELSHQTSASSVPALNWCASTAEEAQQQSPWEGNPAPRRPVIRLEVRNNVQRANERGTIARESFAYACEILPYNAGLQPHAYVDNHKYATRGKRDLAEDLYPLDGFTDEEDRGTNKSNSPTFLRRLVQRKKVQKLMAFGLPKSRRPSTPFSAGPRTTNSQSLALSSVADPPGRYPGTTNHPPPPTSPPPPYATISRHPTNVRSSKGSPFVQ